MRRRDCVVSPVPKCLLMTLGTSAPIHGLSPSQIHWDYAMPAMEGGPPRGVADAWPRAVECGMSLLDILEATCSVASAAGHPSRCSIGTPLMARGVASLGVNSPNFRWISLRIALTCYYKYLDGF